MIAQVVVDEVRRLLGEKELSQRKIAVRLGISRGTVNAIALGRRKDRNRRSVQWEDGFIRPHGLPQRCAQCGAMVQMPCLACHIRSLRAMPTSNKGFMLMTDKTCDLLRVYPS